MTAPASFEQAFMVGGRRVGAGERCFVIAEAGVNHNGDVALAKHLIDAAHKAGADAVKFQTFKAEKLVSSRARKADYQVRETGSSESQLEMLRKLELPLEAFRELQQYARRVGIIFLSTPFDCESADFLESLNIPALKVASGELTNISLVRHVARKRKPMILSTGMSTLAEVRSAVDAVIEGGNRQLALLHCVSNYPAEPASVNLNAMATLRDEFSCPIGFSDHTAGAEIALAAVALGAGIIEKHLTLDRTLPGSDHRASMEPSDFAAMVGAIRKVEAALGNGIKQPAKSEAEVARAARRSLIAATNISVGSVLAEKDVAILRPGTGLAPAMLSKVVGRRAKRDIAEGEVLALEMLQ